MPEITYHKSESEAKSTRTDAPAGFWWVGTSDEIEKKVVAFCESLKSSNSQRGEANLRHARLYENVEISSLSGASVSRAMVIQSLASNGIISMNVVASAIDTLAAKIAKNKPRPMFTTSGADWTQKQMAKKLDKFMRGVFYETKIHVVAQQVFVDACVFGTGFLYPYWGHDNRINVERVMPNEIFIDDNDGLYGKPTSIARKKLVHRAQLVAQFPECEATILRAAPAAENITSSAPTEMIEVWEVWHMPSKDDAGDGRRVICISEGLLLDEEYDGCFPFVVLRAKPRTVGFWGKGDAETLMGLQLELNRLIRSISEQLRRKGRGRIFIPIGSKVEPAHMTNGFGDIIKYAGNVAPSVDNGSVVSADEFQQVDRIYERALQEVGVSQLSAGAKKPAGLDAAVALREYSEIESERFALRHLAWEQFFLDFAELVVDMCEERKSTGYKVKVPGKRVAEQVDFKDIDLDRDSYVIQMFPVSSLPQTPSARLQQVTELQANGFVSPAAAARLLDFPDLEAEASLGNAALDDADAMVAAILDEPTPEPRPLEPYQDAKLVLERATAAWNHVRWLGCPEDRLMMLQDLIDQAAAALAPPEAPPAPPMDPMMAGAPPMDPMMAGAPPMPPPMPPTGIQNLDINVDGGGAAAAPMPAVPPLIG